MAAVYDFMPHIDRSTVGFERQLYNIYCAVHTGTKTSGIGKVYLHRHRLAGSL